ncbi:hypothetical protein [Haladaptatus halobius]|uniref:hypothetical protein n=1 Tax=Haladaptatus halobius TaxID=2884875 RepID=UPI001D0B6B2B|nr:hypothetical protein [Haladaptatus halobius]
MTDQPSCPPPESLSELQQFSTEDFRAIEEYHYQDELSPKRIIQSIARLAVPKVEWRGPSNANSLRDFWYNPVKPILERAFPEKLANPEFNFGRRMSRISAKR